MKQVLDDTLNRIAEAQGYPEQAPEFGERAWRVKGRCGDIIYWDIGNGWCDIMRIIPKKEHEGWLQQVFDMIESSDDA